jgi:lipoic acid synthetase
VHPRLRILLGAQGLPAKQDMRLDPAEPANVARMAASHETALRGDHQRESRRSRDGGSAHFAETVRQVRARLPDARVEVLTPDFCGDLQAVARVLDAGPHVFNHNMETVPRSTAACARRPITGSRSMCWISRAAIAPIS